MHVRQIMSQPVAACQVGDSLNQAARLMWENDCGVLPVVDEAGCVTAMVTDRDICMAAYTQGKPLTEINVRTAMSQELYACGPDDSVVSAEELMRAHQVRRLPVVDPEGRPLGILSLNDIALVSSREPTHLPGIKDGISVNSTAQTLAALSAHRLESEVKKLA